MKTRKVKLVGERSLQSVIFFSHSLFSFSFSSHKLQTEEGLMRSGRRECGVLARVRVDYVDGLPGCGTCVDVVSEQ